MEMLMFGLHVVFVCACLMVYVCVCNHDMKDVNEEEMIKYTHSLSAL